MLDKMTREQLCIQVCEGIPTRVLQRLADYGGLQELMAHEIQSWDTWSEGTVEENWLDLSIAIAGGINKLDVYREDSADTST